MRDWKTYKPAPSAPAPPSDGSLRVDQPQSEVADPKAGKPYLEITLDMNAEQLTLLFEDPDTFKSGPVFGPGQAPSDFQDAWRTEAMRSKADIAETFGPWSSESQIHGATYYRKATRLP